MRGVLLIAPEVYLACDLLATATKDAHLHDSACGYCRAGDLAVHRLPLRSPCRLDTSNLETTNEPRGARQARDQPGPADDRPTNAAKRPSPAHTRAAAPAPQHSTAAPVPPDLARSELARD